MYSAKHHSEVQKKHDHRESIRSETRLIALQITLFYEKKPIEAVVLSEQGHVLMVQPYDQEWLPIPCALSIHVWGMTRFVHLIHQANGIWYLHTKGDFSLTNRRKYPRYDVHASGLIDGHEVFISNISLSGCLLETTLPIDQQHPVLLLLDGHAFPFDVVYHENFSWGCEWRYPMDSASHVYLANWILQLQLDQFPKPTRWEKWMQRLSTWLHRMIGR